MTALVHCSLLAGVAFEEVGLLMLSCGVSNFFVRYHFRGTFFLVLLFHFGRVHL
jgi:hypothetical protein